MVPSSVNCYGVLTDYVTEIVASFGRSTAEVRIAMAAEGDYRFGISLSYSYGGIGSAPSTDDEAFATYAQALDGGIAMLLRRWHTPLPSDPASVHEELRILREQLLARQRQPSLF